MDNVGGEKHPNQIDICLIIIKKGPAGKNQKKYLIETVSKNVRRGKQMEGRSQKEKGTQPTGPQGLRNSAGTSEGKADCSGGKRAGKKKTERNCLNRKKKNQSQKVKQTSHLWIKIRGTHEKPERIARSAAYDEKRRKRRCIFSEKLGKR